MLKENVTKATKCNFFFLKTETKILNIYIDLYLITTF